MFISFFRAYAQCERVHACSTLNHSSMHIQTLNNRTDLGGNTHPAAVLLIHLIEHPSKTPEFMSYNQSSPGLLSPLQHMHLTVEKKSLTKLTLPSNERIGPLQEEHLNMSKHQV